MSQEFKGPQRRSNGHTDQSELLRVRFFRPLLDPSRPTLVNFVLDHLNSPYRLSDTRKPEMTIVKASEHALPLMAADNMARTLERIRDSADSGHLLDEVEMNLKPSRFSARDGSTLVVAKAFSKADYASFIRDRGAIVGPEKAMLGEGKATTPHITLGRLPGRMAMSYGSNSDTMECVMGGVNLLVYGVTGSGALQEQYKGPLETFTEADLQ